MEGLICAQIDFSGYTNKIWGHFVMFSGLLANKNNSQIRIHKRTAVNQKKLRTGHLRICVSVCDLKKSQPNIQCIVHRSRLINLKRHID